MTKGERMKEIAKASPDFGKRVGYKMCVVDEFHDMKELLEENAELKAQIEKMKCCGNCAKRGHICVAEEMQGNLCGKNKVKWELRR